MAAVNGEEDEEKEEEEEDKEENKALDLAKAGGGQMGGDRWITDSGGQLSIKEERWERRRDDRREVGERRALR